MSASAEVPAEVPVEYETQPLGHELVTLAVVSLIAWAAQLIATDLSPLAALGGVMVLAVICVLGILLARIVPVRLPSVAWISLVGIVSTVPSTPWGPVVLGVVENVDFLALTVACLAYAGIAISRREIDIARRSGWKLVVVGVFVLLGTFLASVVIADLVLRITE